MYVDDIYHSMHADITYTFMNYLNNFCPKGIKHRKDMICIPFGKVHDIVELATLVLRSGQLESFLSLKLFG